MAATFTGSSYLSIASVPASQNFKASPFTLSIWVYVTSQGGTLFTPSGDSGVYVGIVGSGTSGSTFTDGVSLQDSLSTGSWYLDLEQGSFTEELFVEGGTETLNTWTHFAGTWDGTTPVIYKNGVVVTPINTGGSLTSTVAWNRIIVGGFNGDAQDAWVFNRVLTLGEIQALYQGRNERVSTANIVGHWPLFADNRGLDISGQGRNLTATGTVVAATRNAPIAYGGPGSQIALRTLAVSTGTAITGAGTTNVTGSSAMGQSFAITAAGTTQVTGAAAMSEVVALTAAGTTNVTGAAAMQLQAALTAAGLTNVTGSAAESLSIALAAAGLTQTSAAAVEGFSAAISAAGLTNVTGAAVEGVNYAITTAGTTQTTGSAVEGLSVALTSAGTTQTTGAAAEGQSVALTSAGLTQTTGAAAMGSSSGTAITAAGTTQVTGSAAMGESVATPGSGTTQTTGAATLGQAVAITSAGTTQTTGAAQLVLVQPITAAGTTQTTGAAALGITLPMASAGSTQTTGAANMALVYSIASAGMTSVSGTSSGWGVAMQATGTTQTNGFSSMQSSAGGGATGGPFRGNVSRRTMYAGRRRMRIV